MRAWTLTDKVTNIGLEEGTVLTPKYYNYPFDFTKCKKEASPKGLFVIKYADFHGGDLKMDKPGTFDKAVKIINDQPKGTDRAFYYSGGNLWHKTVNKGGEWRYKPKTGNSLFVYGESTGHQHEGRTLIRMNGVRIDGGDGKIDENLDTEEKVIQ